MEKKFVELDGVKYRVCLRKVKTRSPEAISRSERLTKARNLRGQNVYRSKPENIEKIKARTSSYYQRNKEKIRAQQKSYREAKKKKKTETK